MMIRRFIGVSALLMLLVAAPVHTQAEDFDSWLESFKTKAQRQGISPHTLNDALTGLEPDDSVIALDRKQPEGQITLEKYLKNTISVRRVRIGRAMLRENAAVLSEISKRYGVQPKYIVALWGIESDYGNYQGNFSVVQSLATLAFEGRRADFFAAELMAALRIMDKEGISRDELTGSWAGAMGNCQFMPSTYLRYAVDASGDGKRDIWHSEVDTFASIANYLSSLGWDGKVDTMEPEVVDAGKFQAGDAGLDNARSAAAWGKLGLVTTSGNGEDKAFQPDSKHKLYAIYLSKADEAANKPTLVSENFKALLNWNRSRYFATAVSTLADAINEE
jgi:membrane-bound lytic murein transglycosylase B